MKRRSFVIGCLVLTGCMESNENTHTHNMDTIHVHREGKSVYSEIVLNLFKSEGGITMQMIDGYTNAEIRVSNSSGVFREITAQSEYVNIELDSGRYTIHIDGKESIVFQLTPNKVEIEEIHKQ